MPRLEIALVVGKFAPFHRGHAALVEYASRTAARVVAVCWSNPDFDDMPNAVRAEWIRTLYPDVQVLVGDDGPPNADPDATQRAYVAALLERHGLHPDVVVTSEDYGHALAASLGAEHVAFDPARRLEPVSGTAIRADVHGHRGDLDPIVYAHFVERVVFLGAESTGKTTLTRAMAEAAETTFVEEYGRTYYEAHGGELGLGDYVEIARHHRQLEDRAALDANRYLFVDTNAITTMFFSHYYNRESLPELRMLADQCRDRYQHVFVCADDIPFEQDGWRDNAVWRARMHGMVLHDLAVRNIDATIVTGTVTERIGQVTAVLRAAEGHDRSAGLVRGVSSAVSGSASSTSPPRPGREQTALPHADTAVRRYSRPASRRDRPGRHL